MFIIILFMRFSFNKKFKVTFLFLYLFIDPSKLWAVQSHGGLEGMVIHEIGHALLVFSAISILIRSVLKKFRYRLVSNKFLNLFLIFIILWNILTFLGHYTGEIIDISSIKLIEQGKVYYTPGNVKELIYVISLLDHIFLVPAFVFLLLYIISCWRANENKY